ncbi:hypothetical protein NDU88_008407 [Pleurodeles waltl]|uniref:Uncharacterized protein n=1 Tax=Pleurodeles waltl TaxID=8319 RepID=A0AAV7NVX4_PLEWA|nr:hypothetical protein NDU88_008390 [Pleurodeles waltl]KAJ1120233.1 hypothetical protein NDU88_008407 [Pleurodeles waltl]
MVRDTGREEHQDHHQDQDHQKNKGEQDKGATQILDQAQENQGLEDPDEDQSEEDKCQKFYAQEYQKDQEYQLKGYTLNLGQLDHKQEELLWEDQDQLNVDNGYQCQEDRFQVD